MYSAALVTDTDTLGAELEKYLNDMPDMIRVRKLLDPYTALSEITQNRFDLVIIDVSLPDRHVLEFAARLLVRKPTLLIVIMANGDEYALKALQLGVMEYILRPVGTDKLEKLEEKLKRRGGEVRDGP